MLRKTFLSITAFLTLSFAAYAQPAYFNYDKMKPLAGIFSACWKLSLNEPKVDCEKLVAGLARTVVNTPVSQKDVAYTTKYLENIMFTQWYNEAMQKKLPWNEYFADAESLSNACSEWGSPYSAIDCMNKKVRPNLKDAWAFLNGKVNRPTQKESDIVDSYYSKTMFACIKTQLDVTDFSQAQIHCLTKVKAEVGEVNDARAAHLIIGVYARLLDYAAANGVNVSKALSPRMAVEACGSRFQENVERIRCLLGANNMMLSDIRDANAQKNLPEAF